MELDDFKSAWQTLNQKLDRQNELSLRILREGRADKARHGLRPLAWGQAAQMALGAALVLVSAGFWSSHRQAPHLLATGLLMQAYGLALVLFGARMELLIRRIDFTAPVLGVQKDLAGLRRFFVVGGLWLGLPWWLLWIPLMMMAFMGLGVDLYLKAPLFVRVNLGFGAAGLAGTLIWLRWAMARPRLAVKLEASAAGRSLNRAQRLLDEIASFDS